MRRRLLTIRMAFTSAVNILFMHIDDEAGSDGAGQIESAKAGLNSGGEGG